MAGHHRLRPRTGLRSPLPIPLTLPISLPMPMRRPAVLGLPLILGCPLVVRLPIRLGHNSILGQHHPVLRLDRVLTLLPRRLRLAHRPSRRTRGHGRVGRNR